MAETFPTINSKIYNYTPSAPKFDIVEDESDVGYSKRRLRSTKYTQNHSGSFKFTRDEFETFQVWVWTNLLGGTLSFTIDIPVNLQGLNGDDTTNREVRFVFNSGEPYSIKTLTKDVVIVSFTFEEV
jgi:hypothetical protein